MNSWGRFGLFTVVVVSLVGGQANALPAIITNPSFEGLTGSDPAHFDAQGKLRPGHFSVAEEPNNPNGFFSVDAVPGWEIIGYGGTMAPRLGSAETFVVLPEGGNTLFFDSNAFAQQILNLKYTANTRYRLRVDVGHPANTNAVFAFRIGLGAGHQLIIADTESAKPNPGQFQTAELAVSIVTGDSAIGQPVTIMLFGSGLPMVHYDNVRLDAEPLEGPQATIAKAVEIAWLSRLNEFYRIERATRLENPDWIAIAGPLSGSGQRMSFFEVASEQVRYYRVVPVGSP